MYKPLSGTPAVAQKLQDLSSAYPRHATAPPLVVFLPSGAGTREVVLDAASATMHLVTGMITACVRTLGWMHKQMKRSPPPESRAFFAGHTFAPQHSQHHHQHVTWPLLMHSQAMDCAHVHGWGRNRLCLHRPQQP